MDLLAAASRYVILVAQGTDVKLWETALRQQIYLGDDSFIARMQSLLDPQRKLDVDVPHVQRQSKPMSITDYLASCGRDQAIGLAYQEGRHAVSAIARELGLSVARISRVIAAQEAKGKT
jgi:putative transposase